MSIFAVGDESASDKMASLSVGGSFPDFPGEHPTKAQLEPWIDTWTEDLNTSGYGAFTRGEVPFEVLKLKVMRPLLNVPADASAAAVINAKNADIEASNDAMKEEYESKLNELRNRLAGRLSRALRKNANQRLKALNVSCRIGTSGSVDGEKMWLALVALKNTAETDVDMKVHQKTVERLRDTPLADNCSSQDWEKRMTEFNTSNDLTARPLTGQELTKVLLDMMPEDLATDKRRIKAALVAASKMDDPMHASQCIVKEIADAHQPGKAPTYKVTAAMVESWQKTMETKAKAAAVAAVSRAPAAGSGGKKTPDGAKKGKWAAKLPNGEKCSKGTCVYTHNDEVQCWRDPRKKLTLHANIFDDPEMLQSILSDRAKEARRLGCTNEPVEKRAARAAAAVLNSHMGQELAIGEYTPPLTVDEWFDGRAPAMGVTLSDQCSPAIDDDEQVQFELPEQGTGQGYGTVPVDNEDPRLSQAAGVYNLPTPQGAAADDGAGSFDAPPADPSASLPFVEPTTDATTAHPVADDGEAAASVEASTDATQPEAGGGSAPLVEATLAPPSQVIFMMNVLMVLLACIALSAMMASAVGMVVPGISCLVSLTQGGSGATSALALETNESMTCGALVNRIPYILLAAFCYAAMRTECAVALYMAICACKVGCWIADCSRYVWRAVQAPQNVARGAARNANGALSAALVVCLVVLMMTTGVGAHEPGSKTGKAAQSMYAVAHRTLAQRSGPTADRMRFLVNQSSARTMHSVQLKTMSAQDVRVLAPMAGSKGNLTIYDSGAFTSVVGSTKNAVPGSVQANTLAVSTANGETVPPLKCDVWHPVGLADGTVTRVLLKEALVMKDCAHTLISAGRLARDGTCGTVLEIGGNSYMSFPNGSRAPLMNLGVIVLPAVNARWAETAAAMSLNQSAALSGGQRAAQGGNSRLAGRTVHCRANHRADAIVNDWHKCSNASSSWKVPKTACDDCLMGSSDKVPSKAQVQHINAPGDLVSYDVYDMGLAHVHGGQRKILGIHDHYSKFNWVCLLRSESADEMCQAWRQYANVCKMHRIVIRRVNTDNHRTHTGDKMTALMRDEIKAHYTTIVPNEPRQNGAMERQWRTMGNDTRKMLQHSKLPRNYAWYALYTSVQVGNTLPHKDNPNVCSHLLFTGHKPDVQSFRVWGCMMYAQLYDPITKQANRALRLVHLGRAPNQPGYIGVDPETKAVHISVHCRFVETECPGFTLSAHGWEQVMPSYHDMYVGEAERVVDVPLLAEDTLLGDASPPLLNGHDMPTMAPPSNAAAPPSPQTMAQQRGRRGTANYSNPVPGASVTDTAMAAAVQSLQPGGRAFGTQVLALADKARGAFFIYVCGGKPHPEDLDNQVRKLSASEVYVVNIDTLNGGHSDDIGAEQVAARLEQLAGSPDCLGVVESIPCSPYSASRFNGDGPSPIFTTDHPDGEPGSASAASALRVLENALRVGRAALVNGGKFLFEQPVGRGAGSQFAIAGREKHSPVWGTSLMKAFVAEFGLQMIVFDQCPLGADTQKTTQLACSTNLAPAVRVRLAHLKCDHAHGTHAPIVGQRVTTDGGITVYRTKQTQTYTPQLNRLLAESLLAPPTEGGWLQQVGAVVTAFTNRTVQSVIYYASDLHALAVGDSNDPLVLLRELQTMHKELWDCPGAEAIMRDVAPMAAAMCVQMDARAVAGPSAHVDGVHQHAAFAVSRARHNTDDDPNFRMAMRGPERAEWLDAMQSEMHNFEEHNVFSEEPEDSLPTWNATKGRAGEVVDMLWILKKKYGAMRELLKLKARGTINGKQGKAIDERYNHTPAETYAPAVRHNTCKMMTAAAAVRAFKQRDIPDVCPMRYQQADFDAAFLQGKQPQGGRKRYVRPPQGFRHFTRKGVPIVWLLVGNCYGTEDAPRVWFETIMPALTKLGFVQSDVDPCLLSKTYPNGARLDIGLYVDDTWAIDDAGPLADADWEQLRKLGFKFTMAYATHFLNMNVQVHSPWRVSFSMQAYILRMADTYVPDWKTWGAVDTPGSPQLQKDYDDAHDGKGDVDLALIKTYRGKTGALIYTTPIRCDAQYVVSRLSRAQTFPTAAMDKHADRLIVYLAQTAELSLTYDGSVEGADTMECSTDSDWAVGHSTSAFAVTFCAATVASAAKRQPCIAMSSTEAELIAASHGALELQACMRLADFLGVPQTSPAWLWVDNSGAVELSRDRKSCHRSRHVDRRYFKVRELASEGLLKVGKVATEDNVSDVLTKVLDFDRHWKHVRRLMNLGGAYAPRSTGVT